MAATKASASASRRELDKILDLFEAMAERVASGDRRLVSAVSAADDEEAERDIDLNVDEVRSAGHYLSGMLRCSFEWYWGVDRLHFLEERLRLEGASVDGSSGATIRTDAALKLCGNYSLQCDVFSQAKPARKPSHEIEFFFSFRSPYSQLAIKRVFRIARATGAKVRRGGGEGGRGERGGGYYQIEAG